MKKIKLMNKIAAVGTNVFDKNLYEVSDAVEAPDAMMVRSASLHEMEFNPELLAIARAGAGVNNIPTEECAKRGIVVFNTPGANANGVKELAIAALMLASRDIVGGIEWIAEQEPSEDLQKRAEKKKKDFAGCEIKGKTLGIIGLGAIGVMVANAASALGMKVIGYDPYLSINAAFHLSSKIKYTKDLNDIFAEADYITVHVPLNDGTRNIVGADAFTKMKDGVVILNFARNGLVDEVELVKQLESGKVRKYVTDFVTPEISGAPNTLVTPHLGASTKESEDNCAVMAVEQVRDYLENGNIKNSVNYPALDMGQCGAAGRLSVNHRNIPNMLAQLTSVLGAANVNVANISNASRGNYAYTLIDTDSALDEDIASKLASIDGVLKVRVIK